MVGSGSANPFRFGGGAAHRILRGIQFVLHQRFGFLPHSHRQLCLREQLAALDYRYYAIAGNIGSAGFDRPFAFNIGTERATMWLSSFQSDSIEEIRDIPVSVVNRILYQRLPTS